MSIDLYQLLRERYAELPTKQRQVADVILSNPTASSYSTVEELATASGVTKATVVRFCQSLGFVGYAEVRACLRGPRNLEKFWPLDLLQERPPTHEESPVFASLRQDLNSLQHLFTPEFEQSLENAAQVIAAARRIVLISTGSHAATGLMLTHNLNFIGRPATLENRGGTYLGQALANLSPDDLVISVVLWHVQPEVSLALRWCRANKIPTLAITDNPLSATGEEAGAYLVVPAEGISFFRSQVASMAAANALMTRVASVDMDRTVAAMTRAQSVWDGLQIFGRERGRTN